MVNERNKLIKSTYSYEGPHSETNGLSSETVPDQTMSVREILQRHSSGWPMTASIPYYNMQDGDNEDDLITVDPRTLDLSERVELAKSLKLTINELRSGFGRVDKETKNVITPTTINPGKNEEEKPL